jgi:hypothetical protein
MLHIRPPMFHACMALKLGLYWSYYGTHVRATVPRDMEHAFRGRKSYATQNVMAAVSGGALGMARCGARHTWIRRLGAALLP